MLTSAQLNSQHGSSGLECVAEDVDGMVSGSLFGGVTLERWGDGESRVE